MKKILLVIIILFIIYGVYKSSNHNDIENKTNEIERTSQVVNTKLVMPDIQESEFSVQLLANQNFTVNDDILSCTKNNEIEIGRVTGINNDGSVIGYVYSLNYNSDDKDAVDRFGEQSLKCYDHLFQWDQENLVLFENNSVDKDYKFYMSSIFDSNGNIISNVMACCSENSMQKLWYLSFNGSQKPEFLNNINSNFFVSAISPNGKYLIYSDITKGKRTTNYFIADLLLSQIKYSTYPEHWQLGTISNDGIFLAYDYWNGIYYVCDMNDKHCTAINSSKKLENKKFALQPMQMKISSNSDYIYVQQSLMGNISEDDIVLRIIPSKEHRYEAIPITKLRGYQIVTDNIDDSKGFVTDSGLLLVNKSNAFFIYNPNKDQLYSLNDLLSVLHQQNSNFAVNDLSGDFDSEYPPVFVSRNDQYMLLNIDKQAIRIHFPAGLEQYLDKYVKSI